MQETAECSRPNCSKDRQATAQECEQPHLVSPGGSEGEMKEGGVRVTAALACDKEAYGQYCGCFRLELEKEKFYPIL